MRHNERLYRAFAQTEFHWYWDHGFAKILDWINPCKQQGPDFVDIHPDPELTARSIYGVKPVDFSQTQMRWLLLLYHNQVNGVIGARSLTYTFQSDRIRRSGLICVSERGKGHGSALELVTGHIDKFVADQGQMPVCIYIKDENQKTHYQLTRDYSEFAGNLEMEQIRWQHMYSAAETLKANEPRAFVFPRRDRRGEILRPVYSLGRSRPD